MCGPEETTEESAVVFRDPLWTAQTVPGYDVPGWFFLRARRYAERITGLDDTEAATFGRRLRPHLHPRRRARTTEVVRALLKQLGELPDQRKAINYLMILVTWPAPTVRPPSRMANFRPSSMATGWISSTRISVLSPGMTISVPSGRFTTPVTSVVRK